MSRDSASARPTSIARPCKPTTTPKARWRKPGSICKNPSSSRRRTDSAACLISPAEQRGADGEARSNRRQQHQIAFFEFAFLARGFHRQRNRGRGGVAEAVDVHDNAFRVHRKPLGGRGNDSAIRLVGNEGVN